MLWNWYTVDSCFISRHWHNTSSGMFAGSCIGVILLTMTLELLRRCVKEYDRYLVRARSTRAIPVATRDDDGGGKTDGAGGSSTVTPCYGFRPSLAQQAVRAFLHMLQFAVAYFIML